MSEEQTPIQVTTKNPKKVEAGKRLAEYNRKQREEYKKALMAQNQAQTQPTPQTQTQPEDSNDIVIDVDSMNDGPKPDGGPMNYTIMGGGVIVLVLIGAYFVYKNKDKNTKVKGTPPPSGPKKPVRISKLEME